MHAPFAADTELWQAFRAGDPRADEYLYRKYVKALYGYGMGLCADPELVSDCIQDLFVYLFLHRETLGEVKSTGSYLFASFRRRLLEMIKQQRRFVSEEGYWPLASGELRDATDSELIQEQTDGERRQALQVLIDKLPTRQREALYLLYYEKMDYPAVAQVMGLETKTVYNLLYEAMTRLRQQAWRLRWLLATGLVCSWS